LQKINVNINFVILNKMKNLDLMSYDVVEMNQQEMLDNEGGSLLGLAVCAVIVLLCASSCTVVIGDNNNVGTTVSADSTANNSGNGNTAGAGSGNASGNK
jgi:hypothetical protein